VGLSSFLLCSDLLGPTGSPICYHFGCPSNTEIGLGFILCFYVGLIVSVLSY
jgi:hypothetical protein